MKCIYGKPGFVSVELENSLQQQQEQQQQSHDDHDDPGSLAKGLQNDGSSPTSSALMLNRRPIKHNEIYIDGIGSVKVLRAKVDHKLENGNYRA